MAVCSLAIRSIRVRGKAQTLVKSVRRHFDRNEELLPQNLTGMHGLELLGHVASFRRPNKAHPESIVNVDRVLPLAIARERLKAIAKKRPQVAKISCGSAASGATWTRSAVKPFGLRRRQPATMLCKGREMARHGR